jgi:hypothetical protein
MPEQCNNCATIPAICRMDGRALADASVKPTVSLVRIHQRGVLPRCDFLDRPHFDRTDGKTERRKRRL